MKFTKMHGCGNDYIYVNGFTHSLTGEEKSKLAQTLSHRHFGIGADGLILINPSDKADFEMEMYNADGSRGEMCGNGIRCVGKYVYDYGLTQSQQISVESYGAVKHLTLFTQNGKVQKVRVDMGSPIFPAAMIPVLPDRTGSNGKSSADLTELRKSFPMLSEDAVIAQPIEAGGMTCEMTCVSMGNPHAVIMIDTPVSELSLDAIGPAFENHKCFPNRVNTEFVEIVDRSRVKMRVWERGSGETLACGTGCCATAVACILAGKTDRKLSVEVLGGELEIEWDISSNVIYMTGPAATVFDGEVDTEDFLQ